jgi:hypothetical protein
MQQLFLEGKRQTFSRRQDRRIGGQSYPYFHDLRNRFPIETGISQDGERPSIELCKRIARSYEQSRKTYSVSPDSTWFYIQRRTQGPFLEAISDASGASLQEFFHNIHQSNILQGIDHHSGVQAKFPADGVSNHTLASYDLLVRVCEAVGAIFLENPFPAHHEPRNKNVNIHPDELLSKLDTSFGFRVTPAPVGHGKVGLKTSRGVFNYRDLMNLYTAYRVHQVVSGKTNPWIVEIGGGFGKAAYYAWQFGIRRYTIIDLSHINAVQAFLLGTCLPDARLNLFGDSVEAGQSGTIDILPPPTFKALGSIDLAFNQNSLPEMDRNTAIAYLTEIKAKSSVFLSINQEAAKIMTPKRDIRQNIVNELVKEVGGYRLVHRMPFWMRPDHVEELYTT